MTPIDADALVIGAGPAGLYAAFQLGLYGIAAHVVESLDRPGGQCAVYYPDKPVFDLPGLAASDGALLTAHLVDQIRPFAPVFRFGEAVTILRPLADGRYRAETEAGTIYNARVVVLAVGDGAFRPGAPQPDQAPLSSLRLRSAETAAIPVDAANFRTGSPGLHVVGDAAWYPGKLRLLVSAFHEAALMAQSARAMLTPAARPGPIYTTSSSVVRGKLGG